MKFPFADSKYAGGGLPLRRPLTVAIVSLLAAGTTQAATITVTTLADGSVPGQCTLRDAVQAANTDTAVAGCGAGSGADQIVFGSGLTGTIALTGGALQVTSPLSISGPGPSALTIDGGGTDRIFTIGGGVYYQSAISGVTLTNGFTDVSPGGAAVYLIVGELELSDCVITGNTSEAPAMGGAIAATGFGHRLSIEQCELTGNQVQASGMAGRGGPPPAFGGAVFSHQGNLEIRDSQLSGNQSAFAGGAVAAVFSQVEIARSTLHGNSGYFGGAVFAHAESAVAVQDSLLSENEGMAGGGLLAVGYSQVVVEASTISGNVATAGGGMMLGLQISSAPYVAEALSGDMTPAGIAPYLTPAYLQMTGSEVEFNTAMFGGGGLATKYGSLDVSDSRVRYNQAGYDAAPAGLGPGPAMSIGGGIFVGGMMESSLRGVEITHNSATQGGGLMVYLADVEVVDSVISHNLAYLGGGVSVGEPQGYSGPLVAKPERGLFPSQLNLTSSRVADNTADIVGGGLLASGDALLASKYSEVSGNFAGEGGGGMAIVNSVMIDLGGRIEHNQAGFGGGLVAGGKYGGSSCGTIAKYSSIAHNEAVVGGGAALLGCEGAFMYSTLAYNHAENAGGGLAAPFVGAAGPPVLANTTISSNTAGLGGGLFSEGLQAVFVTVSHNESTGIEPEFTSGLRVPAAIAAFTGPWLLQGEVMENPGGALIIRSAPTQIESSLFAANQGPDGPLDLAVVEPSGELPPLGGMPPAPVDVDYTLIEVPGTLPPGGTGNLFGVSPGLGPLADNGGRTLTRALPPASVAINAGAPVVEDMPYDQRGRPFFRVFDGRADMGAYEFIVDRLFHDRFEVGP